MKDRLPALRRRRASAEEAGEKSTWTSRNSRRRSGGRRRCPSGRGAEWRSGRTDEAQEKAQSADAGLCPRQGRAGARGRRSRHVARGVRGAAAATEAAAPPRPRLRYHQLPVYAALDSAPTIAAFWWRFQRPGVPRCRRPRIVRLRGHDGVRRLSDDAMRRAVEAPKIGAE